MTPELVALFDAVRGGGDTAYILGADRTLRRFNEGWVNFARANGGEDTLARWPVGASVLTALPPFLLEFFTAAFDRACKTGEPWEHDYECSSPEEFREFRMIAYPIGDQLVVTHTLRVHRPHDRFVTDASVLVDGEVVKMCAYCRRVNQPTHDRWVWIPTLVATMPIGISHGICKACAAFHFGAA